MTSEEAAARLAAIRRALSLTGKPVLPDKLTEAEEFKRMDRKAD